MTHDVSETEVKPRTASGDEPASTGQSGRQGPEAPPGTRVDATEAEPASWPRPHARPSGTGRASPRGSTWAASTFPWSTRTPAVPPRTGAR